MAAPRRAGRSRFPLFVLILASVTLLTLDARDFGPVERMKDAMATVLSPVRSLGDSAFSPVGDAWRGITDRDELESENEQLRDEIAALRAGQIADQGAADELAAIKAQLGLGDTVAAETLVAEVIAGSISNFDGFVVEINRGRADGLANGMPVITEGGGLVGRVEDTRQRTARIRLITDPDVSVGAIIVGTDEIAIVSGGGLDQPLEVGRGSVPVSAKVAAGDVLVTSGGDRSPYPPGIPIGTVTEVIVDEGALEKRLVIEPTAAPERLRFVTVVLFDPDNPPERGPEDSAGDGSTDDGAN